MLIHSDPNNMNSIVYHLIIVRYSMKTLHWYFPWATASHLYNRTVRGEKLQQLHCYHPFSDSLDIYLTKNHYENYSPKMVPIAKIWGSGSWTRGKKGRISSWEVDYKLEDRSYPVWCHIRVRVYFIILAFLRFILRVVVTLSLNQLPLFNGWLSYIYMADV